MIRISSFVFLFLVSFVSVSHAQPAGGAAAPVTAFDVQRYVLSDEIEAVGTTYAIESVTLTSNVTDKIDTILFTDNQIVKKGDVLIEFASAEQSAELKEAMANLTEARKNYDRVKQLADSGTVSQARLDEESRKRDAAQARLNAIKARLDDRILNAPFDGVLGLRSISTGMLATPGTPLVTLDDIRQLKIDFAVPEKYLFAVKEGMTVTTTTPADETLTFTGEVISISPRIDPNTRAFTVRALIDNPDMNLKPGMLMNVTISLAPRQTILIPENALIALDENHYVYTIVQGKAQRKEVAIGSRQMGVIEITDGLKPGDQIVVDGLIKMRDGVSVNIQEAQPLPNAKKYTIDDPSPPEPEEAMTPSSEAEETGE